MDETLLLAEDDPNDQLMMTRSLQKLGVPMKLRLVGDGEEAISYLAGEGVFGNREHFPLPKLTLLDLKMPRRSGLEVLEWIRSRPEIRTSVVVMLSSSDLPEDVRAAYQRGANSYLVKPNSVDRLNELNEALVTYWLKKNVPPISNASER